MLFKDSTNIIPSINVKTVNKKRKGKKIGIQKKSKKSKQKVTHQQIQITHWYGKVGQYSQLACFPKYKF